MTDLAHGAQQVRTLGALLSITPAIPSLVLSPDWPANWLAVMLSDGVCARIQHIQGKALMRHPKAPPISVFSRWTERAVFIYHSDSNWYSSPESHSWPPFKPSISETELSSHTRLMWGVLVTFSCRLMELYNNLPFPLYCMPGSLWFKWHTLCCILFSPWYTASIITVVKYVIYMISHVIYICDLISLTFPPGIAAYTFTLKWK